MEKVVLGYERLDSYTQVLDVLVREKEGKFKLMIPQWPETGVKLSELNFIDVSLYQDKGVKGKSGVRPIKMNSDGREYLAMRLDNTRDSAIFRLIEFEKEGNEYVVKLQINEHVEYVDKKGTVPAVVYNGDGHMDIEEDYVEHLRREVKVIGVTDYDTGEASEYIRDMIENDLDKGLINDFIKEAGDSEISLAVTMKTL